MLLREFVLTLDKYFEVYYTPLYCTILYNTILYYIILYYTILYCTILYYTVLYYTVLYCTILYNTTLFCTTLYCTILYYTIADVKRANPLVSHFMEEHWRYIVTVTSLQWLGNDAMGGVRVARQGVVRHGRNIILPALLQRPRLILMLVDSWQSQSLNRLAAIQ